MGDDLHGLVHRQRGLRQPHQLLVLREVRGGLDALDTVERIVVAEDPLLAAGTAADASEEDTAGEAADDAARTSGTDAGPARTSGTEAAAEALAHPATTSLTEFLAGADAHTADLPWTVADENATLSINYTSGTTGQPKGVMLSLIHISEPTRRS